MHKLMDTSDVPQAHMARGPMAGLLSMLLVLLAFIIKVVSIVRYVVIGGVVIAT